MSLASAYTTGTAKLKSMDVERLGRDATSGSRCRSSTRRSVLTRGHPRDQLLDRNDRNACAEERHPQPTRTVNRDAAEILVW